MNNQRGYFVNVHFPLFMWNRDVEPWFIDPLELMTFATFVTDIADYIEIKPDRFRITSKESGIVFSPSSLVYDTLQGGENILFSRNS